MRAPVRSRLLTVLLGLALVIAGVVVIGKPLLDTYLRGRQDSQALIQWRAGGSDALARTIPSNAPSGTPQPTTVCGAASAPGDAYALVTFPSLSQFGYAGVAEDGDWGGLLQRSMVHWHGSPAPGQQGNVIIAFHREPGFEHIDLLGPGMMVEVQDRACHSYVYRVQSRADHAPDQVSELVPTSGHDLTLITCTPFYIDNHRLVWRASLFSIDGKLVA